MPAPRPAGRRPRALAALALGAVTLAAVAAPAAATETVAAASAPAPRDGFTLTLLFTNDGESALLGVDADIDGDGQISPEEERSFGGVARARTLVDQLRVEAATDRTGSPRRASLLLSGGDNFLPGPEFAASIDKGAPYYDSLAMKAMDYDASIIGNHEFDFGPEVLADFINGFDGTLDFVSSNLDFTAEPSLTAHTDDGTIVSTRVFREAGEQIGIIGLTTPDLPALSSPRGVRVLPELAEITNGLAEGLAERGVTKVVLVSHLQDIDNELALVPELSGVDVVVGAGGGEILANDGDPLVPGDVAEREFPLVEKDRDGRVVPVVTTTGDYKYIGRIVLNFDRAGDLLGWDEERTGPVRVAGVGEDAVEPDPWVRRHVEEPVLAYLENMAETVVATSEVPLDGVRENVRSRETNLGNLLADAVRWQAAEQADEYDVPVPEVAIQNGGGIRNGTVIPAGPVSELNTFEVSPFGNFVSVVPDVPRDRLRQLLERGVAALPGQAGQFMQVSGMRFTYDVEETAQVVEVNTGEVLTPGERVRDVVLDDGTVLVADGEVVDGPAVSVAVNDFSARGGDGYPFVGLDFTVVGRTDQQALSGYLREGLGGTVSSERYPSGGEGRIVSVG
ncbi:bifunctional metallophosphatase/5'-nucleotidase [Actinoalloteichus caeruleus]|uniref:5'-nucleotidase n=1 Tax=Actinoalloteichus caeruleus DSM 43889 TaxID=1120930 RepID=A0ABT1JJ44_ACTCY|nr:5'-nucleotidase C-terminal domain-containing protein [Actinoalloteichus caeruleus]MCP2332203.1 5'-nucleotidase [Actinoalloteichus caeruleus DSM 43889]